MSKNERNDNTDLSLAFAIPDREIATALIQAIENNMPKNHP
jgi:hypothetical protein